MTFKEFKTLRVGDLIVMDYPNDEARKNIQSFRIDVADIISAGIPVCITAVDVRNERDAFFYGEGLPTGFSWQWASQKVNINEFEPATEAELMSLLI